MNDRDRTLGMNRPITRRDFLNGVSVVAAGALVPGCATPNGPASNSSQTIADNYPPIRSGLRGSHTGSFEIAHDLAFEHRQDWGAVDEPDSGTYDLVVVGGGLSGLAAAFFRLQRDPSARILILDNHDDFGGHAKRNEFQIGDKTIIGYGGSQSLENPERYGDASKKLLVDLGIDLDRFETAYDRDFYRRNDLAGGIFFDRATYGVDRVVRHEVLAFSGYLPLAPSTLDAREAVAQMPISEPARVEMLRLLSTNENQITEVPAGRQEDFLGTISYRDFLSRYLDIREPEVFALLEGIATDMGVTIDTAEAIGHLGYVGMPGLGATAIPNVGFEEEPYIAHFPDGNASIARLLVRKMIPQVAPGSTMDDIVRAQFDYARLDEAQSQVRLRLDSTAVRVEHEGEPESADRVAVTYVRKGRAHRVWARTCVLAGYNAMIPHLCPDLPKPQREALALAVKVPIIYTTVLLRNWQAWKKLGIGAVAAPGSYHGNAMLDFPVSIGGYAFAGDPSEPISAHLERFPKIAISGSTPREQHRAQRYQMLATPFEDIEREIRTQLTGMLSAGGFDPARDIEAIAVNRWAHGYSYSYNPMFERAYGDDLPHVIGRERFGRIAIANSDAAASANVDGAVSQAHRAIQELSVFGT